MKRILKNRTIIFLSLTAILAFSAIHFIGIGIKTVKADNTPQTLPFSQNWTTTTLITVDDIWTGVPGIIGYRGDDLNTTIGVDLQTVLGNGSATPQDVNANRSDPSVFASGGLAEFDGIANPVVAMQGSATSDIPHLVIHLNTTGQSNIQVAYNARDIDAQSGVDAIQQINTQFRVGGTGDYANVPGGYIADASSAGDTQVTPVSVTLPATANNQSLVEVRIMTTNALGSDEFIGIDDINITAGPVAPVTDAPVDFNGDGKTDFAVVRNTGGGPSGQITWFNSQNGSGATTFTPWGIAGDSFVPGDYDGDRKDDIAVWRGGAPFNSYFYVLNSSNNTFRSDVFGQTGDNPAVFGDYDGDGKDDPAIYRVGASAGDQSFWAFRASTTGVINIRQWGQNGDFPAPGDYDGDGKMDLAVQRNNGGGQARFYIQQSSNLATVTTVFGTPTDVIVPGDYDGDGKTDLAVTRGVGGQINWFYQPSSTGTGFVSIVWGNSATDFPTVGDYDGDGKTDVGVWRPNADPSQTFFYVRGSATGSLISYEWGQNGDYPVANYNRF